jgi:hypothetical protein
MIILLAYPLNFVARIDNSRQFYRPESVKQKALKEA